MGEFYAPGADEYGDDTKFKPAAEDSYRVSVDKYVIVSGNDAKSEFNPDGKDRVRFYLTPLFIEGDEDAMMVDTADKELPVDKFMVFFFDPDHLGLKPVVSKSRKFLSAALGVPVDEPVRASSLDDFCQSLVGRELVVDVTVKGKYNNIVDSRPVVKKARKRKEPETPLVEAAAAVFKDETDDNEPF